MLLRREFLRNFAGAAAGASLMNVPILGQNQGQPVPAVPAPSPQDWMEGWMKTPQYGEKVTRGEKGVLIVSRFADPMWFLFKEITWFPDSGQTPKAFTVPKGFVTDLASIPPIFWSVLPPDGDYAYAAILHDYLYWTQIYPKDQADSILKAVMTDFHVNKAKVTLIYEGVHKFGDNAWNNNAKLKAQGQSRFLKNYPDDPKVRWNKWSSNPSNFYPNPS